MGPCYMRLEPFARDAIVSMKVMTVRNAAAAPINLYTDPLARDFSITLTFSPVR